MNTVHYGLRREESIIDVLGTFPFLSSSLIRRQIFEDVSDRMAQRVLTRMHKRKMLKRFRYGQEYIYHIVAKNQKWKHWLEVARFHFAMMEGLANWQVILDYKVEKHLGFCVTDIYYKMIYKPGDIREIYVEVDRGSHMLQFGKYPESYTVILVVSRKLRVNIPDNWIVTSIEEVQKHGIRLGSENRKVNDKWFQGVSEKAEEETTKSSFFQQGKSIR